MQYTVAAIFALAAAVKASPFPQGVTMAIAPSASAPAGCSPNFSGSFGIAVMTGGSGSASATQAADGQPAAGSATAKVTQISDGQPQAATTPAPVSQISDGQPQAGRISQISDGQIQAPVTMNPINQIGDGQIQNQATPKPKATPVSQISDGQIQGPTPKATPVSQIGDGQPQAAGTPKATPVSQISDGQIQATTAKASGTPVAQISDGQPQASGSAVAQISDGQPQASGSAVQAQPDGQPTGSASSSSGGMVACSSADTLSLTLKDGVLLDNQGRTGYIAANYQFQFDKPAQTGAIYTSGFSLCSNGSIALGGSAVFYQCRSGDFYNLYDRSWAPQCEPVQLGMVTLQKC